MEISIKIYILSLFFSLGCIDYPCKNGGTCAETANGGYVCTCTNGWSGSTCEHIAGINVKNINCLTISKLFFRFMYFLLIFCFFSKIYVVFVLQQTYTHINISTHNYYYSLSLSLCLNL